MYFMHTPSFGLPMVEIQIRNEFKFVREDGTDAQRYIKTDSTLHKWYTSSSKRARPCWKMPFAVECSVTKLTIQPALTELM
ncbi:hypothetical protein DUNSADRAFT_4181 [Dunaliella salina]|uniref:Encoded protein n=1 Tax=Dunaliella salina TaxID=3046 RepID=A0ABQ7FUX5_DUNSA|nr:hypothetical protein DUNSADRAFT_4181 [Dunaliella salina]|eukprot:KAF5826198.1 hypothetical protein DUNSADRAFT_4181 [Dunaliella salina]